MNKKEFVEWLDQFPDDTNIEVAVKVSRCNVVFESFDPKHGGHWDFLDFRNNSLTKPNSPNFGQTFLQIGGAD